MASPMEDTQKEKLGVHFAPQHQEISPDPSLQPVETITGLGSNRERDDLNPEAEQELQQLKTTLKNNMQTNRMQHHAFEPMSLPGSQPASRVPSGSNTPSRRFLAAGSSEPSPRASPPTSTVHSPPLTPAATKSRDGKSSVGVVPAHLRPAPDVMTPERSASPQRHTSAAPTSAPQIADAVSSHPKPASSFSIGPSGDSQPPSQDQSPNATPAATEPGTPRASTPADATSEPTKHRHHSKSSTSSEAHSSFRFGNRDPAIGYSSSGTSAVNMPTALPGTAPNIPGPSKSNNNSSASLSGMESKRSSIFGGAKKEKDESSSHSHSSSKSNLKRFFKIGDHKHKEKRQSNGELRDGAKTPPSREPGAPSVPFADDHGLSSKYGKFGKMLGSGAGGSVRLMKRSGDGVVFAVKQFRDRHTYESEKDYNKKVTAEFCIGSTLHHGNIIETIDIVQEKGKWYEVMEYAPFDLFATVMTGKMGKDEITCSTLQILSGVLYLHSMGLAHRDLKLDNVVINDKGVMKLIDFGSAVVFRYPFENEVVLATGVVGSDPYLAPEVYDNAKYDPRCADIWSIAIIFCCMTLRRFPWKAPRISDNSYRLFVSPPDPDQDKLLEAQRHTQAKSNTEAPSRPKPVSAPSSDSTSTATAPSAHRAQPSTSQPPRSETNGKDGQPTIKGPMRLLRLLPRETRHIIGRMLELDPAKRATMDEILQDPWVQNSLVCRQEESGAVISAPNHTHALQPSNAGGK